MHLPLKGKPNMRGDHMHACIQLQTGCKGHEQTLLDAQQSYST